MECVCVLIGQSSHREGIMESFHTLVVERYGMALQICLFLSPRDIFRCFRLNKGIKSAFEDEVTWKILYYHLCSRHADAKRDICDTEVLCQMNRPINEAAIGWRVEINDKSGEVIDFRINPNKVSYKEEYLILFDANEESVDNENEWVAENDAFDNNVPYPSNSRIRFLSPPPSAPTPSQNVNNNDSQLTDYIPSNLSFTPTDLEESKMLHFFRAHEPPPSSWRKAYRNLLRTLPCAHFATIDIHSDEVLDVKFNHTGTLLGAVSRDGTISITSFSAQAAGCHPVRTITYKGKKTTHACNVEFSLSGEYMTVVSSDPFNPANGSFLEIFFIGMLHNCDEQNIPKFSPLQGLGDVCYSCHEGVYVADLTKQSESPPSYKVWQTHSYRMPFNVCSPWLDEGRILYTERLSFPGAWSVDMATQKLRVVDVVDSLHSSVCLRVNGHLSLTTALRLAPGKKSLSETANSDSKPFEGVGIVYATNAKSVTISYPQLLCLLPLSAFGQFVSVTKVGSVSPIVDYDAYPHVDLKGAIIGIATNTTELYHNLIIVNVRPQISDDKERPHHALLDISRDVEIRAYSAFNLQHLFTFTGHQAFTLKDCPFYIFLDMFNLAKNDSQDEGKEGIEELCDVDESRGLLGENLLASGSEDCKIYIWQGKVSTPVMVRVLNPSAYVLIISYRFVAGSRWTFRPCWLRVIQQESTWNIGDCV